MDLLNWFFREYFSMVVNLGLWLGIFMGVLILLRPVTVRLLTPGQRVFLWGVGWIMGVGPSFFPTISGIPMPVPTLPDLVIPRAERGYPLFFPDIQGPGSYRLALPGGWTIPFPVSSEAALVLTCLGCFCLMTSLVMAFYSDRGVKRLARSGVELDQARYRQLGVAKPDKVVVRLCPNLPTSFVIRSWGRHEIALQKELTEEQMRLVLLHEREHVNRHDPWIQGLAVTVVCLYFWNPVLWLAYHLTRRDMELACDRRVLKQLGEADRRAYAHTLVDLACDKPRWGGLTTFGECDASRRVKAAARWEPGDESDDLEPRQLLGWAGAVLLAAFLVLGGPSNRAVTADLVADLEQDGGWSWLAGEMAEQHIVPDKKEPLWIGSGGNGYAQVYIRDETGVWWKALILRLPYQGHLDAHLRRMDLPDTPDLSDCAPISWEIIT